MSADNMPPKVLMWKTLGYTRTVERPVPYGPRNKTIYRRDDLVIEKSRLREWLKTQSRVGLKTKLLKMLDGEE